MHCLCLEITDYKQDVTSSGTRNAMAVELPQSEPVESIKPMIVTRIEIRG